MPAIEITGLSKSFGSKSAVDDLSLCIEEGELFSLLGVNGAGKTTTIRMLSCLSRPSGGDAFIFSKSILNDSEGVKSMINISTQETAIARNLTVKENLELIAGIYGYSKKESQEMALKMLEDFNMQEIADTKSNTLSGGWQRRLSIAMALVTKPKVLFLDEPTLGLDVLARRELWQEILKLRGKVTIIMTTHYMEEAEALSDRIGIIVNGKLKALGNADELKRVTNSNSLEEAFVYIAQGGLVK